MFNSEILASLKFFPTHDNGCHGMLLRKIKDTISEGEFGKRGEEYVAAQAAGRLNLSFLNVCHAKDSGTSLISQYQYTSIILRIFRQRCTLCHTMRSNQHGHLAFFGKCKPFSLAKLVWCRFS